MSEADGPVAGAGGTDGGRGSNKWSKWLGPSWWRGESIGGWATLLALIVTIVTFIFTYRSQERFNETQIELIQRQLEVMKEDNVEMARQVENQKRAADEQKAAAEALRESAAVAALGGYLRGANANADALAWEAAEAVIDIAPDDEAWQATARRALVHHKHELVGLECNLYSPKFLEFVAKTFNRPDLCAKK
jgi:hypothetical protein